jgi:hypothetical protein
MLTYRAEYVYDDHTEVRWYNWETRIADGIIWTKDHAQGLESIQLLGSPFPLTVQQAADVDVLLQYWPLSSVREAVACLSEPGLLNSIPPVLAELAYA